MKNRTIYDVLDKVMEDYSYSIKKTGNKVELKGEVYIQRLDRVVTHDKIVWFSADCNNLKEQVEIFKDEFKNLVVKVLKEHQLVLTDDEEMIKKLMAQCKELREELEKAKKREKELQTRIDELEIEKYGYPVNPLWTGVTYGPDYTGTPPDEWHYHITCDDANSAYSTGYGTELPKNAPKFRDFDVISKARLNNMADAMGDDQSDLNDHAYAQATEKEGISRIRRILLGKTDCGE